MAPILTSLGEFVGSVAARTSAQFFTGMRKGAESQQNGQHQNTPGGIQEDTQHNTSGPTDPAARAPRAMFSDPYGLNDQLGFKERPSPVTYNTLRDIVYRMPVISTIINTRINQMAAFAHPVQSRYDMGFRIKLRDDEEKPTDASRKTCEQFTQFLLRTGVTDAPLGRDSFETYVRKTVRDSLMFDQCCTEIVPANNGQPAEFYAVDASNVRLAQNARPYLEQDIDDETAYVEVYEGVVQNEYRREEMIFGVRNPCTDIRLAGYGTSELEMLLTTITSLLQAWNFNALTFSQGTMAKGILNIREEGISAHRLNAFEQRWNAMLRGEENAHRVPIVNAKDGIEWINLQGQTDQQFKEWMDFLIKCCTAAFSMAPEEINFRYGNSNQASVLAEDSNRDKLIESKERGLRPLLRHLAQNINQHLIWPINEAFSLHFSGLDAMTPEEQADFNGKRVRSFMTLNEIRAEDDKEALPGGDVILDPTYVQSRQAALYPAAAPFAPQSSEAVFDDAPSLFADSAPPLPQDAQVAPQDAPFDQVSVYEKALTKSAAGAMPIIDITL